MGVKKWCYNASRYESQYSLSWPSSDNLMSELSLHNNTHYITILSNLFESFYLPAAKSSEVKRLFFSWTEPQTIPENNKLAIVSYYSRLSTINL